MKKLASVSALLLIFISLFAGLVSAAVPIWQNIDDQTAIVGQGPINFNLVANDADGHAVTYTANTVNGIDFNQFIDNNANPVTFNWQPQAGQEGVHQVVFTATSDEPDPAADNAVPKTVTLTVLHTTTIAPIAAQNKDAFTQVDIPFTAPYGGDLNKLQFSVAVLNQPLQGNQLVPADFPITSFNGGSGNIRLIADKNVRGGVYQLQLTATIVNGNQNVVVSQAAFNLNIKNKITVTSGTPPTGLTAKKYSYPLVFKYSGNLADLVVNLQDLKKDGQDNQEFVDANGADANKLRLDIGNDNLGVLTQELRWDTPQQADAGAYTGTIVVDDGPAKADQKTVPFSFTIKGGVISVVGDESVSFGSESAERSNPEDDDSDSHVKNETRDLLIKNTGDLAVNVQNLALVFAPENNLKNKNAADYQLSVENAAEFNNLVLEPSAEKKASVKGKIVKNLPAIDGFVLKKWQLGRVTLTGQNIAQKDIPVYMQAQNMLEIKKVEVCVTSASAAERCKRYDDDDTVDDLKPGDRLSITVVAENTFNEDTNLDIDATAELKTNDKDIIDLDDDSEDETADVDAETEFELSADVEDDADGTATVKVRLSGDDDNGALHGEEWNLKFKVNRESHEIDITSARVNPAVVSCDAGARTTQVDVELRNIGKKKERDVKLEARVERGSFSVFKSESNIELDKDDEHRVLLNFNVPTTVEPGIYAVELKSFYKRTQVSDTETVPITVPDCGFNTATVASSSSDSTSPPADNNADVQVSTDEVEVKTGSTGDTQAAGAVATATPVTTKAKKTSFGGNSTYVAALVAVIVVLLIIGGVLVALIARRP